MYKPIITNEEINFKNLYFLLSSILIKYLRVVLFFVFIYMVYFFAIKDPKYTASVSFYTDYTETNKSASLSILENFQGVGGQGGLSFSISNYIVSDKFLESVILYEYFIDESRKNLIDLWNISGEPSLLDNFSLISGLEENQKKILLAKEKLKNSISFSEDRKTGLNTISVITKISPDVSKQVVEQMFNSILSYSNEITSVKAREKVSFIQGRVDDIKVKLELSENEMLAFVQNNKNLNSPNLELQKNRIQRDINL